jgi:uncharacterized repeat protein (TIGR01451 family)
MRRIGYLRRGSGSTFGSPFGTRRMLVVLAAAVGTVLLAAAVALADTVATNFENPPFVPGSVNGQNGWKSAVPGNIPSLPNGYDQAVVANGAGAPAAFASQSLRLSNAYGTGPTTFPPEFHYQTYSKPTTVPAGESLANTEYTAQFSFISIHPDREQPGLKISVSPDMGEGGRMSYIGLTDTPAGIEVSFFDTPEVDGEVTFAGYDLGTLPRNAVHTIKFWMKLNPGPDNDLVRIFIDGSDVGQCFTTWENFYRATSQEVPNSDRLLFLSGNRDGDRPSLLGGGYLFDNVATTTANGPGPPGCDVPVEKDADEGTVSAGGRVGYRITVRNRGRAVARHVRVCDRVPRRMTFVSADRKLRRLGRLRCLVIPRLRPGERVSFHIVLQVDANAPPGAMDNTADVTPVPPPTPDSPGPGPPAPGPPAPPPPPPPVRPPPPRVIARAKAKVKVVKRVKVERQSRRPRFTG